MLAMDQVLERQWHVACKVNELTRDKPIGISIMGHRVVVWRDGKGVYAWDDLCIHRGMRLSLGKVCDDEHLQCPYHGWKYDGTGHCVSIPAHPDVKIPVKARARAIYQVREHAGLIWVNLSDSSEPPPTIEERVRAARQHVQHSIDWKGEKLGILEMRRHYTNYFRGIPHIKPYRSRLVTNMKPEEIFEVLDEILEKYGEYEFV